MIVSQQWTYSLNNNTIVIDQNFSFTMLSILASSGSTVVSTTLVSNGILPTPITLQEGQSLTITGGSDGNNLIDGITISTAGITSLIAL